MIIARRRGAAGVAIMALVLTLLVLTPPPPPAGAQGCLAELTAGNETELGFAISCYNVANANSITTVTLTSNVTLSAALPAISNPTAALLHVEGNGRTLDANSAVDDAIAIIDGDVFISKVTITGATDDGISHLDGAVLVRDSTISGNAYGITSAALTDLFVLVNSTVHGNTNWGANIVQGAIISSTIVDNNQGFTNFGDPLDVEVHDSLIARNRDKDCGAQPISADGNVFGDATCNGTVTADLASSLAPDLAVNGCTEPCTKTIALLPGSPAVDAAGACSRTTDQRGIARTSGQCDSGSYEAGDCLASMAAGDEAELGFALGCYNVANANSTTTVTLTGDIILSAALPEIFNPPSAILQLEGNGHTLDADSVVDNALDINNALVVINQITITGATNDGIVHGEGFVEVHDSTIAKNAYGITSFPSTGGFILQNSTVQGNTGWGARIEKGAIISSTIVDNDQGLENFANPLAVTIQDSLIARNTDRDCVPLTFLADSGDSAFGDDTCNGTATPGLAASLAADLALNGCTVPCTQTIALLPGSPAIDVAGACAAVRDQRGVNRSPGKCDAGAFEAGDVSTAFCGLFHATIDMNTGASGTGTAGDDVILGTAGDDVINGSGGNDTICGGDGDDEISGGDGDDVLLGEGGDDVLLGEAGNDSLSGGVGRDIARGGPGLDYLTGGDGNDRLLGGIGDDILNGDAGNDYLGGFGGADTINGGPGNDTIFGGFGADTISAGEGDDKVFGLIGDDIITGGPGNDTLNGDRGNDTINGNDGDDTINGGNASDTLAGDAGNDTVNGGKANDALDGGPDTDICSGNKDIDTAANCEQVFGVP